MNHKSINPGQTVFLSTAEHPQITGYPLFGEYRVYAIRRATESIYHVLRQKDSQFYWEVVPAKFIAEKLPDGFVDSPEICWFLDLTGDYCYENYHCEGYIQAHRDIYRAAESGGAETVLPHENFIFVGTTCFVVANIDHARATFEYGHDSFKQSYDAV